MLVASRLRHLDAITRTLCIFYRRLSSASRRSISVTMSPICASRIEGRPDHQRVGRGERGQHRAVLPGRRAYTRCAVRASTWIRRADSPGAGRWAAARWRCRTSPLRQPDRQGPACFCRAARRNTMAQTAGRDRIAGKAQDRDRAQPAEQQRLARPHRDLPEIERQALAAEHALDKIVVADRSAARGHQQLQTRRRSRTRAASASPSSGQMPRSTAVGTPACQHRRQTVTVFELAIWLPSGVSPGQRSSLPVASRPIRGRRRTGSQRWPMRGGEAQRPRVEQRCRRRARPSRGEIEPGRAHESPGAHGGAEPDRRRRSAVGVLLDDDRVGAVAGPRRR